MWRALRPRREWSQVTAERPRRTTALDSKAAKSDSLKLPLGHT